MKTELQIFNNEEFGRIRAIEIDGKPYFIAGDIAKSLGYSNIIDAIARHCKGVVKHDILTNGGKQQMNILPEGDMYRLISHSKLPSAEKFESWIFDEVLPEIRKTGTYGVFPQGKELLALAVLEAQKTIEDQNNQIKEMKPKALFADAVSASHTTILIGDLAKILKQNGIDIGQNRLFEWLRNNEYLIRRKGADFNSPTQKSMELGLFEIKETCITHSDGHTSISKTTKVSGKGRQYFINKFLAAQGGQTNELQAN